MPTSALTPLESPEPNGAVSILSLTPLPPERRMPILSRKINAKVPSFPFATRRPRPSFRLASPKPISMRPPDGVERKCYPVPWVEELRRSRDGLLQALHLAEEVQKCFLPRTLPELPGVRFGAALRACDHLAGDFYNVTRLDRDTLGIYLGDVMGHGPAAALLSVFAMQSLHLKSVEGHSYRIIPPSKVLGSLNTKMIAADFPGCPFVTMVYGTYDVSRRVLTYCSGGHPPALILRPGQPDAPLAARGALLGVFEDAFIQEEVTLLPGDRVIFFSDGFELVSFGDAGDGVPALCQLLRVRDERSPQQLVDDAISRVRTTDDSADDLTVVLMEVREAE